ncbi:DgyrCDS587 [Dimorphilus gyrociliatus]|uniref:DgyrCDS587 n=1 Tax=Dimorphilus gyrociliatus TaxID=2664684 RepID=A0A7I8V7V2_9ANNE|nr:DgyrCDS587 [Dimorphilus gyrociliatus]
MKSYQVNGNDGKRETNSKPDNIEEETTEKKEAKMKEEKEEKQKQASLRSLYRYGKAVDYLFVGIALICSIGSGVLQPVMFLLFGEMTNSFVENAGQNTTEETKLAQDRLTDDMNKFTIYFCGFGAGSFILNYIRYLFLLNISYKISSRMRSALFTSLLHKEIEWFDKNEIGTLNSRLVGDINKVEEGIGDKVGTIFAGLSGFIGGFVIAFVKGWKLTLVILATTPIIAILGAAVSKLSAILAQKELQVYSKAGAVAEQAISNIRTISAFSGQQKEAARYDQQLGKAKKFGIKKGLATGIFMGSFNLAFFGMMALALWYGGKLYRDEGLKVGDTVTVFFSVLLGAFFLGLLGPALEALASARAAAYALYQIIDSKSTIDSNSKNGKKSKIQGNIEFRNVKFRYPTRQEIPVLNGVSFQVSTGDTMALVGSSGCGKSTSVQLLQRFYDPEEGEILLDGVNIKDINVGWLRDHIGVVSQEPILFDNTIKENIRLGREGVTDDDIEKAARNANAYNFITKLPYGFNTNVGERGAQLSGGQKQRIAIARALVRNPVILLLDEATSALDTESESIVQDALNKASAGRTTIVIAHRLSTIRNANTICAFDKGHIVEKGNHDELMKIEGGIYNKLVTAQQFKDEEEKTDDDFRSDDIDIEYQFKRQKSNGSNNSRRGKHGLTSMTSIKDDEVLDDEEGDVAPTPFFQILKLNAPEWCWILVGVFGALITGGVNPVFAVLFGDVIKAFTKEDSEQKKEIALYCGLFAGIGVLAALSKVVQDWALAVSSEKLTLRLRKKTFRSIIKQDISYFDDPKNSTGAITTRLSADASSVQGAAGVRLGTFVQSFGVLGIGVILAMYYSWKLTLAIIAFVPLLILGGAMEMIIMSGMHGKSSKNLEEASKISTQCLSNIRTVAQLCKEKHFALAYKKTLQSEQASKMKKIHVIAFGFSISQSVMFFVFAATFAFGTYLIKNDNMSFDEVFKVFGAIAFGAQSVGELASFAPNYGKARIAATRLFRIFARQPLIDSSSPDGKKPSTVSGVIEFKDVFFSYPTRPNATVLKGLNIKVEPGQTLALVGSSGCGKSTSVSLLERFYNPFKGVITLDGVDLESLNISWLRQQIGLVQQEPILFDCTIRENIAYGDNSREVPIEEVIEAAKKANIHNFISSLPQGYDTPAGDKGTQLSGGQKQRIAIARALVREPKIILLDEATSALDTESEAIVQEALDKAREGRTCITIAHRLSTIRNADCIVVISNGKVSEIGTHSELMNAKEFYYTLVKKQEAAK